MAGLSIKQISNFLSTSKSIARQTMHRNCSIMHNSDGELRITIADFVQFLLEKEDQKAIFKHNYELNQIEFCYRNSAETVYNRLCFVEGLYAESEVKVLETRDILSLPFYTGFKNQRIISDLCRSGVLAAFKTDSGRWGIWKISVESLALYIYLSKEDLLASFIKAWLRYGDALKENDVTRYRIMRSLYDAAHRVANYYKEEFTAPELAELLDMPKNQVEAIFFTAYPRPMTASAISVAKYLKTDENCVALMYDRWEKLQKEENPFAQRIVHLLMIYEYYVRTKENE